MLVKAKQGLKVPREDNARRYITDEPVEVPETSYYLRRLMDGDLERMSDDLPKPLANEPVGLRSKDVAEEPVSLKDKE